MSPRFEPVLGQRSTSKTHVTSMSCKLEPAIWLLGSGQWMPCFDRCQLIVAGLFNIKEVHSKPRLYVSVNFFFEVWPPCCATPSSSSSCGIARRRRAIPLVKITMRKSTHGFPFLPHDEYGALLGGPPLYYHDHLAVFGYGKYPIVSSSSANQACLVSPWVSWLDYFSTKYKPWLDLLSRLVSQHRLAYGWRAGNLNRPIRIQQAGKILVSWRQVEIRQLLSLEMARKGIYHFKNQTRWQKVKNVNHFVFLSFYFGAKNGSPELCMATRS